MLKRLIPDPFILWLIGAVILAALLPVRGAAAVAVDWLTYAAIFTLFFLHGIRLSREALLGGLLDWRLHAVVLAITFLLFPILTLGLAGVMPNLLTPVFWTGLIFLSALPSTVQSSIAYTSMAGGNVAGAVAAAALSNLVGVIATPLLVSLMLEAQGAALSWSGVGRIFSLILLPFVLGHLLRPWLFAAIKDRPRLTMGVDKGTILLAVYGAFSATVAADLWRQVPPVALGALLLLCLLLLGMVLAMSWRLSGALNFSPESRAAILFCGSVKSLASGVPMARILFAGPTAGLVIVPVMLFHTLQLIVCAWIAARLARTGSGEQAPGSA